MASTLKRTPPTAMTIADFEAFCRGHRDPQARFELFDGIPIRMMSPERVGHGRAKLRATNALGDALEKARLDYEAVIDSAAIAIDDSNARIPDVSVVCQPQDSDSLWLDGPVVVVEIVSPTSEGRDTHDKLLDYFRVESILHYLVVFPVQRRVIHHRRADESDEIITRILGEGVIDLSPPGFQVLVADLLGPAELLEATADVP